ncbi:rho guanine nucleotide exchange factor 10-like protein [Trichonephila clavata]|uniref:Rho guanine nucleotide exchange factor 10-like protein n=1 Tax=Trichonephila clavata TaxID=2740835 RepID=A0A8X6LWR3_TRICU|nr:rho guanine nucleotide exchange factor 10-like protein [Trichonephila clavata]
MMLRNCHEAKYAKVNCTMKEGIKEEFGCPVAVEFYNKITGGVDLPDQMANTYELDRKSYKRWKKSLEGVREAQHTVSARRGTGLPSKTSQILRNVVGHLQVTTKTRR